MTGLIDEKIFQRQLYKGGLSGVVGDGGGPDRAAAVTASKQNGGRGFSKDELRRLFSVNEDTDCDTRDVLCAACEDAARAWTDARAVLKDPVLQAAAEGAQVSFAWLEGVRGEGADTVVAAAGCGAPSPTHRPDTALDSDGDGDGSGWGSDGHGAVPGGVTCSSADDGRGSQCTGDLAQALQLVDSDADDVACLHARDLVLDSD